MRSPEHDEWFVVINATICKISSLCYDGMEVLGLTYNIEHLCYHRSVDEGVNSVDVKGGNVVDLQQPGLQVGVQEDVKAEELEAVVRRGNGPGSVGRNLLPPAEDGLHTDLLDPLPDRPPVQPELLLQVPDLASSDLQPRRNRIAGI